MNEPQRHRDTELEGLNPDPGSFAPADPPTPSLAGTPCPAPAFAEATAGHRSLARRWPLRRARLARYAAQ